ncbi:hypothetical protein ABK040_015059 [Willaertia magna]
MSVVSSSNQSTSPSNNIPLKDVIILKKSTGNSNSVVSSERKDICDSTHCLEIIENESMDDDTASSCKVCVVKQAHTAALVFEAIPLSVKLVFIVFFAIVSMVVFGALLIAQSATVLKSAQYIDQVSRVSLIFSELVNEVQTERTLSIKYTVNWTTWDQVAIQFNKTDAAIQNYMKEASTWNSVVKNTEDEEGDGEGQTPNSQFLFEGNTGYSSLMDYYIKSLSAHRENIKNRQFPTTLPLMQWYIDWIKNIIDGLFFMSNESDDSKFKSVHMSYGHVMRLKEIVNVRRSLLIYFMLNNKIPVDTYNYFQYAISKFVVIYDQFDITADQPTRDLYAKLITENYELENLLAQFESSILTVVPAQGKLNFTDDDIYNNFTIKINNMRTVEYYLRNATDAISANLRGTSTGALIGYSISTVFVFVVSIVIALIFARAIIIPWKRLLRSQKDRTKELTTSYTQLNLLLERISAEEQKTRKILNSMDDALVTTNSQGQIVHCNDTFYKMFKFTEQDIYGLNLRIQQIIPNLELTELFKQFNSLDTIITPDKELKALTKVGTDFPVRVSLNFCRMYMNDLTSKDDTIILSTEKLVQQEQACIILIHSLSDRVNAVEKESPETIEFKQMFNNPLKKLDFKEYCRRFKTDENISFLEDVEIYKNTTSLQERAQKQTEIYNLYLKPEAKRLLNISKEQLAINNFRISKGLGEIELFDSLEKTVIENLVHDIYKRWKEHEKSEMHHFI